jgi:hypothetical protein
MMKWRREAEASRGQRRRLRGGNTACEPAWRSVGHARRRVGSCARARGGAFATEVGAKGAGIGKRREGDEVAKRTRIGGQKTSTTRGMAPAQKKRSSAQSRYAAVPVFVLAVSGRELKAQVPRGGDGPISRPRRHRAHWQSGALACTHARGPTCSRPFRDSARPRWSSRRRVRQTRRRSRGRVMRVCGSGRETRKLDTDGRDPRRSDLKGGRGRVNCC